MRNISFILCLLLSACSADRDPCMEPKIVRLNMQFMQKDPDTGSEIRDTSFSLMLFNPLDNERISFVHAASNANGVRIRLSPVADSCRWYLQTDTSLAFRRDTLTFHYERKLHFLSNACGYTYHYHLRDIQYTRSSLADTIHSIESVVISDPVVDDDVKKVHVNVFFRKR